MYGRGGTDWRRLFGAGGTPFTFGVMAAYVLVFLGNLISGQALTPWIAFRTTHFPVSFWTLFTWPLAGVGDPISLIFALGWLYLFGGSMERAWGTRPFASFFVLTNVLTAIAVWLASFALGPAVVAGLWVAAAPAVVAWSIVNAREVVSFFFLPIPGPIWGLIGAVMAFFYVSTSAVNPLMGLFGVVGCAAAYWYARFGRFQYRGYRSEPGRGRFGSSEGDFATAQRFRNLDREPGRGFSLARWWKDRQERKRLEEIFRRSGLDDPDDKRR
jgi:Uncharacterized membrane protein (homolog of Drosophila rhomboid)